MDRIFIENIELDLGGAKLNFNASVNRLGDITTRNSSYSNTFVVPRTAKNEKLMSFAGCLGNTSDVPYIIKSCRYQIDTTVIVANGYIKLIETNKGNYRLAMFDGIIDLSVALGNSVLSDLNYDDLSFPLASATTVIDTHGNTEGIIYGVGEFGQGMITTLNPAGANVSCEYQLPSVFVSTIWDKIFNNIGFTYAGAVFTNSDFLELVLAPSNGFDIPAGTFVEDLIGSSDTDIITQNTTSPVPYGFNQDHEITVDGYSDSRLTLSGGDLIAGYTGVLKLTITTTYTASALTFLQLKVDVNGGNVLSLSTQSETSPRVDEIYLNVTSGDVINFEVVASSNVPPDPDPWEIDFTTESTVQAHEVTGGTLIDVNDLIDTDLTQVDFVRDILQRFGLIMIRDKDNASHYDFISMETLLTDRTNAVDWTDKIVSIGKEKYSNVYAQTNKGEYSYPADAVASQDGELLVVNANAPVEKTIVTSPYEIPNENEITISVETIYKFPVWEEKDSVFEPVSTTAKIMRVVLDNDNLDFTLFDSTKVTATDPVPYLKLTDMGWSYWFATYYSAFKDVLDNYKEQDVELNLSLLDFNSLDFTKLVFLKQTGRYYYLDSVRLTGTKSTAKLIEIRNFIA